MAQTGTGLSHCPAPAVLGGFPIIDIPAMEKVGMNVSLGCDGSATNDSSNLLDSLRMAYLAQSYHSKSRGGAPPSAYEMLKTATVGGAKTLEGMILVPSRLERQLIFLLSMPIRFHLLEPCMIRAIFLPALVIPERLQ